MPPTTLNSEEPFSLLFTFFLGCRLLFCDVFKAGRLIELRSWCVRPCAVVVGESCSLRRGGGHVLSLSHRI